MKVTLIDHTGYGHPDHWHAANVLIFTKQTRLQMSPSLLKEIADWPSEKKMDELKYMANTIPSSWEFIQYTFMIEGVTRAFTHQLVRTRTASYAQQTMRVLNVQGWEYATGPSIANDPALKANYDSTMSHIARTYEWLIRDDAKVEDARGVLPTNILTNIIMSIDMRNFVNIVHTRSSPRTQDEYRKVLAAMKAAALAVHPWLHLFFDRTFDKAAQELDEECKGIENKAKRIRMMKLIDQLRAKQ